MKQKMWEKIFHRYDPPAWEQGETHNLGLFDYEITKRRWVNGEGFNPTGK
jgi:hypothetical protein